MVRFKVVRASRLLLGAAIVVLGAVLALVAASLLNRQDAPPASGSAKLVDASSTSEDEAKTAVVFASSASSLNLDPVDETIEIEVLGEATEEPAALAPRVLIYHTHTHEAYEQVVEDPYEALEAWRTTDADHSVVRVGEALAERLRGYGFEVVHDATDHEGEELSTAYTRSLATLEGYEERFDLYIDLHRDAYVEGEAIAVTGTDGTEYAPLMMLIGNGNGFDVKPYYAQNVAFARALEERINAIEPGLCKPVMVKDGRYNQHIGVFAILVEVGHNRNTLRQALNAVPPLAEAIDDLLAKHPDAALTEMKREFDRAQ